MEKVKSLISKVISFCNSYIELCLWLLVFAIGIRFFEAILLNSAGNDFGASIAWNLTGLCYDISLFLRASVWFLIAFVAACFLHEKISRLILRIIQSVMLLLSLIFIVFFSTSGFLLDKVIFSYSFHEIWGIIMSSLQLWKIKQAEMTKKAYICPIKTSWQCSTLSVNVSILAVESCFKRW